MNGAVKMPGVQANITTASRAQSTQSSNSGTEFIKLMQAKNSQAKAAGQEKPLSKPQDNAQQPLKDVKEAKEAPTDTAQKEAEVALEEPKTEEPADVQDLTQQAAAQQTAALLAGMFVQTQEPTAEETVLSEDAVAAVGELLTAEVPAEAVPEMAEVSEGSAVETAPILLSEAAEALPEVKTESTVPAAAQEISAEPEVLAPSEASAPSETAAATETAAQPEAPQAKAVHEAVQKEAEPSREKAETPESLDKANEQIQKLSEEPKAEENPEGGKSSAQEDFSGTDSRKAEESQDRISKAENGQAQAAAGAESFRVFGQPTQNSLFGQKTETLSMKTTPETIPQDLGKALGAKLAEGARTLTVELEPANLGKLTIHLTYEGSRAAVSIMATNPKTLEILNQKASEIAAILEEKTGQETVIYTQKPETSQESYDRNPDGRREREEQEERHQQKQEDHQNFESFAQQLRLGLV